MLNIQTFFQALSSWLSFHPHLPISPPFLSVSPSLSLHLFLSLPLSFPPPISVSPSRFPFTYFCLSPLFLSHVQLQLQLQHNTHLACTLPEASRPVLSGNRDFKPQFIPINFSSDTKITPPSRQELK